MESMINEWSTRCLALIRNPPPALRYVWHWGGGDQEVLTTVLLEMKRLHLSYPCVFQSQGEFWMIPETLEPGAIRLYRADPFSERWIFVSELVRGRFADSTIVRFQNKWWIFTCPNPHQHDTLSLYMADELTGPWREPPKVRSLLAIDAQPAREVE